MRPRGWSGGLVLLGLWLGVPLGASQNARAEITGITGEVSAELIEYVRALAESDNSASRAINDEEPLADDEYLRADEDYAEDTYPGTSATLPIQAVARLMDVEVEAAGAIAAQLADPLLATTENPQEFALNLAISSNDADTRYVARAASGEVRTIVLSPSEAEGAVSGRRVRLLGQFTLDGLMAIFADPELDDLEGLSITLRVTITQESARGKPREVFAGELLISGDADGEVSVAAAGDVPAEGITETDLSELDPEIGVFHALVFPSMALEYDYAAFVGEEFVLRAKVELEAANLPGGTGAVALIGAPFDMLSEVLTVTHGPEFADKMAEAQERERKTPSGGPAFAEPRAGLPLCGLLGLESLLMLAGLWGLKAWAPAGTLR